MRVDMYAEHVLTEVETILNPVNRDGASQVELLEAVRSALGLISEFEDEQDDDDDEDDDDEYEDDEDDDDEEVNV